MFWLQYHEKDGSFPWCKLTTQYEITSRKRIFSFWLYSRNTIFADV